MLRIATWNVNSIRARLHALLPWLDRYQPDVLMLQETKVVDDDFPSEELGRRGYSASFAGQKTYNGVAILARHSIHEVEVGLVGDDASAEKRVLRATIEGLRLISVYVPNGKDVAHPAFLSKLAWLGRLRETLARERTTQGLPLVVGGDFNVAHERLDVWAPDAMEGKVHFHPDERAALARLLDDGLKDSFRLHHPHELAFSWWDYRGGSLAQNRGMRIDYLLVDPGLVPRLTRVSMDRESRSGERPSDHVPVVLELD
jgi:exodeoxyribonuclease III